MTLPSNCPICSQLRNVETSYYKYLATEYDRPLPAAATNLQMIPGGGPDNPDRNHMRRCPTCGTLYSYQLTYEYLINGSEDEEILTRLSAVETTEYYRQRARSLEELRQEIDQRECAAGSLGDYIDHGHPAPAEAEAAYDEMQIHRQAANEGRQRLQTQVETFIQSCPEILHTWVGAHRRVCQALLDLDFSPGPDADTARYVARETLEAWEALLQGSETFIKINTGFLPNYLERLQAEMERS